MNTVPSEQAEGAHAAPARPHVVILGAGFGGLNAAQGLRNAAVDVTVIDRRNYHLFQPLLYQVATAALSPAQIATPIRRILTRQKNATVLMEKVEGVDPQARMVVTESRRIPYDYLVVATGARHAYFGHDEWAETAPGLKTIDDATEIRARILAAFEKAEVSEDPELRRKLLTFVIVGGGPTGVELAGAIAELARKAIVARFPPHRFLDGAGRPGRGRAAASHRLPRKPVAIGASPARTAGRRGAARPCRSRNATEHGVVLADGTAIGSACVLWAAGVMASRAAKWLGAEADRAGRVIVNDDLSVPGHPEILVIGDTAVVKGEDGQPVPGVAPAAKQMGRYAAQADQGAAGRQRRSSRSAISTTATSPRSAARRRVADFGWIRLSGFLAWLLWSFAHLWFLVGFRNRIVVFLDWAWAYATFDRGARLITERRAT